MKRSRVVSGGSDATTAEADGLLVHMMGSEWFSTRAGGLNRYFESLFQAMDCEQGVAVSASAFGDAPHGGSSWGPVRKSTAKNVLASLTRKEFPPEGILDRHFSLYGSPLVRRSRGQRLVVHFQGPWASESAVAGQSNRRVLAKKLLERLRLGAADAIIVLSSPFKRILVEEYGVPPEKVTIIPPGVDLSRFAFRRDPSNAKVVCVRRLERRMGIDRLVSAWTSVRAEVPEATLTIVGTGSEERALRDAVDRSHMTDSITFAGRVGDEELVRLYAESSLSVVPSVALEGFGLIALESLAMGRPPVVTDCGGLPDAVRGLDPSLVVRSDSPEALSERLVLALRGVRPSVEECRLHAESFSWKGVVEKHTTLYRELLA